MPKIEFKNSFTRKLKKVPGGKKDLIMKEILNFAKNPLSPKFKKHKLNGLKKPTFSIKLAYDLRALYLQKKEIKSEIFFTCFSIFELTMKFTKND